MKYIIFLHFIFVFVQGFSQEYKTHSVIGIKTEFGILNNPYTNGNLDNTKEKVSPIPMLEFGIEGMDKNFYVNFKTDFIGLIPDYIAKALNKSNRKALYGALMSDFRTQYNKVPQQYEFNASFTDFDVLGGNISFGYKYLFAGVNVSWASTTIDAYQSVTNTKITKQEPANYYGFNERGNFTYGFNIIGWNNSTKFPVRLICACDFMLMRDYNEKWRSDMGNRLTFDLQGKIPFNFKNDSDKKRGIYIGAIYKSYDINYLLSVNAVEMSKNFTASLFALKLGYSW